jgi:hypothetical protein
MHLFRLTKWEYARLTRPNMQNLRLFLFCKKLSTRYFRHDEKFERGNLYDANVAFALRLRRQSQVRHKQNIFMSQYH